MQQLWINKQIGPGVYQIKETGGVVKASVDRLLADGSMLSAPENAHLLATIDAIIVGEYPTAPVTVGQQGTSIGLLAGHFGVLVQWMRVRGLNYFGHLTSADLQSFIYDSSCGLDTVLKSQERLSLVLAAVKQNKLVMPASFSDALREAGIPTTQSARLPDARTLFNRFIEIGDIPPHSSPTPNRITESVLWGRANTFRLLWIYRNRVEDGLSFEPSSEDISKHIKRFGRPTDSTRTLPIDYMCKLVGMAFTWVYEYGPLLADIYSTRSHPQSPKNRLYKKKQILEFNAHAQMKGWSIRLRTDKKNKDELSWQLAARTFLPTACFVICGIFTARRVSELVSLRPESLGGNSKTGYWISSYVAKRAKNDTSPCTKSVADAIGTLVQLMEIRGINKNQPVFEAINGNARLSQRLRNGLARFGKLVNTEDAEQWALAPHQFRRIFALIYRWQYDHPSLIALSVHLQHLNPKKTHAYTNSKEWKRENQEINKQFTLEKLRNIALGEVKPSGIYGKSLERAISRAIAQIELLDESEQESALTMLIEQRQLELRATIWGYCGAKSVHSNLRRAACTNGDDIRSKAFVDQEKSAEEICAGCLFFATDNSRKAHWQKKSEILLTAANNAPPESIVQNKIRERHQIIERFVRNNFKGHTGDEGL